MSPIIQFKCRSCDGEISLGPEPVEGVACPSCKTTNPLRVSSSLAKWKKVTGCVACGHTDFYIQKDFNRALGVSLVGAGILASTYFFHYRQPFLAMASLVVTALIDLLIYALVGNVSVCYSCHAVYRGFEPNPEHEAFDLKKLEKYGGRTPRFGA